MHTREKCSKNSLILGFPQSWTSIWPGNELLPFFVLSHWNVRAITFSKPEKTKTPAKQRAHCSSVACKSSELWGNSVLPLQNAPWWPPPWFWNWTLNPWLLPFLSPFSPVKQKQKMSSRVTVYIHHRGSTPSTCQNKPPQEKLTGHHYSVPEALEPELLLFC